MIAALKWIGGPTLLAVALIGSAIVAGRAPAQPETVDPDAWLQPEDVLAQADDGVTAPAPAPAEAAPEAIAAAPVEDAPLVIKRILPIAGPIKYGEWHWDDEGVPQGPLVITVDLDARVLSVFRDGYEIGAAAVLIGTPDHPTPLGTFPILTKERHNISEKYGDAPMPWTMRLTWDGVAIHGGSTVQNGYASHGCVSAPDDFVSRLYAEASKGDRVIITKGVNAGIGTPLAG
ncbi:L,D-transpeptidase family protein [Altererythrobacter sp. B11]|uniref:L,D-transpeptidase family protein n=1 Tax=Altererythrobacter sp. B11 TaxID=2060312 RepID=UPI000E5B667E|nr:L,D-transpeptidase family protein [Altererythrobacter sp. B11]